MEKKWRISAADYRGLVTRDELTRHFLFFYFEESFSQFPVPLNVK